MQIDHRLKAAMMVEEDRLHQSIVFVEEAIHRRRVDEQSLRLVSKLRSGVENVHGYMLPPDSRLDPVSP